MPTQINTPSLSSNTAYSRHYGDFRGVDFSSDQTQVHDQRFAYLVNMYKDYQSGQGKAIETIPGYRKRVMIPGGDEVLGIHPFRYLNEEGEPLEKILIHAGSRLYLWYNYPATIGVVKDRTIVLPEHSEEFDGLRTFDLTLNEDVAQVQSVFKEDGEDISENVSEYDPETRTLSIFRSDLSVGDVLRLSYVEGVITEEDALFDGMSNRKSTSFVFNNRLYLVDGKNYLVYDGDAVTDVRDIAYVPTTYINIIPSGENADIGTRYEQRNLLQPKFKHTFIADGVTTEFYMNESGLDAVSEVKVYGEVLDAGTDYTVDLESGKITFSVAPQEPAAVTNGIYPEFYAGIEITAHKGVQDFTDVTGAISDPVGLISDCTVAATFDNRIFLSGNPTQPGRIFYCGTNTTGYTDPTYFGELNHMQDGVSAVPITGMIPVADTLMSLKGDTRQDGSVYFHTRLETGDNIQPVIYPSTKGLSGIGCRGACINFLDDPVFISRLGVEAIGQLSVRYERAVEHRSSLIDAKLANMDLSRAVLEEWNGYLILLVDGKIFMADSRQRYTHDIGVMQYEWYYLEDIGVWQDQYVEYRYSKHISSELDGMQIKYCTACGNGLHGCTCGNDHGWIDVPLVLASEIYDHDKDEILDLTGEVANPPDENGNRTGNISHDRIVVNIDDFDYNVDFSFSVHEQVDRAGDRVGFEALLCEDNGNHTGGVFHPAVTVRTIGDNLYFGTDNGAICSFYFDMRDEYGEIPAQCYAFDERTIFCACATKMDNCGIPHLNKKTVKKSMVVKTKTMPSSAAKLKVRTNRKPYAQIARINNNSFSFGSVDFSDFTFVTSDQSLFAVREKEKKWIEKQYYLYSDEFCKPFALFNISFRYLISGRYKE